MESSLCVNTLFNNLKLIDMRQSKAVTQPVQQEMFADPMTAKQLLELVNDKLTILSYAKGKLERTKQSLEKLGNSETEYQYEFFSPTTVDTQLQLKITL